MNRVALVGCGKEKRSGPSRARDLYTGALFRSALAYAEVNFRHVFIASALHGLVELDRPLEPYDVTLRDFCAFGRAEWGALVALALAERFDTQKPLEIVVLAGRDYAEPIRWQLVDFPLWDLVEPMSGLGIGERKQWLNLRRRAA